MRPDNAMRHGIEKLIEELKNLPYGTTYEEVEGEFHGGQCEIDGKVLGTGYQRRFNIVEGVRTE